MALHLKATGIDFADFGTSVSGGNMTSELLDDYEEGTWTPELSFQNGTSEASKTFSIQNGYYVKVGSSAVTSLAVTGTWSGGNPDNVNVNLPFQRSNSTGTATIGYGLANGSAPSSMLSAGAGVNTGYFTDGEGTGNFTQFLQQHNNYIIGFTMVYRTA